MSVSPTALVHLLGGDGQWYRALALLDSGSEINLMTKAFAKESKLTYNPMSGGIRGIGGNIATQVVGFVSTNLKQCPPFSQLKVPFRVVTKTVPDAPSSYFPVSDWEHLADRPLADPTFKEPSPVDVVFSASVFDALDLSQMIRSQNGSPNARLTTLGWVMSGPLKKLPVKSVRFDPSVQNHMSSSKLYRIYCKILFKHKYGHLTAPKLPNDESIPEGKTSTGDPPGESESEPVVHCNSPELVMKLEQSVTPSLSSSSAPISSTSQTEVIHQHSAYTAWTFQLPPPKPQRLKRTRRPLQVLDTPEPDPLPPAITLAVSQPIQHPPDQVLSRLVEKMFALEEVSEVSPLTPDELKAEECFSKSCLRLPNGRFSVALPLKTSPCCLGETRKIALRRLLQTETRHAKSQHLRTPYVEFMKDYLESKHMELAPPLKSGQIAYYIPHHAVHHLDDPPEKIRVAFNASQKSSSGISLNELLLPGPKLQLDIWKVVTRFRVDKWPVQEYRLCTVTYGTTSAPYLACRVLQELALTSQNSFPQAAEILRDRTYVDDISGGGPTLEAALKSRDQLIRLLSQAQIELRKWASNHPRLLERIPLDHLLPAMSSVCLEKDEESQLKILGLCWNPSQDYFHFLIRSVPNIQTKRQLASQIAKVFDPLGWLIPITVFARAIFRVVCQASFSWDDPLPSSIIQEWSQFAVTLPELSNIRIPRFLSPSTPKLYLVGFADASERAYAAVVYLVSLSEETVISLIMSKARIAPMKPVTLPRLELCAAHLLALTLHKVSLLFPQIPSSNIFALSDSTIALAWITATPPPHRKVFVGNRVAAILEKVPASQWFHVPSSLNPADCASRGLRPQELVKHHLWWEGPPWLKSNPESWPLGQVNADLSDPIVGAEIRSQALNVSIAASSPEDLEYKFSSLHTLINVVAWCLSFAHNARNSAHHMSGPLKVKERGEALRALIIRAQRHSFLEEIEDAQSSRPKLRLVRILGLFIHTDGVLRVGGRLRQANIPESNKHPALLPHQHPLTALIIQDAHVSNLHVGPTATHAFLRNRYWITNGKNVVRRQLSSCNKCFSIKPSPFNPIMGQLPEGRASASPPFTTTGIDYAGPFNVKIASLRSAKVLQCYLAIFICFSTKAIHLELVTDLTTQAFLAALNRFIARRGMPSHIWSDNGTNFVGATRRLKEVSALLKDSQCQESILRESGRRGVEWHYIPPRAPHFGGLWEAAVKSTKRLLKVTLGLQEPTMECFLTIICQVEAILNSRPLTALSSSPDDLQVLTPGHFLIMRPMTALPTSDSLNQRTALKSKWAMAQFTVSQFWKRWHKEYLLEQQAMLKWHSPSFPAAEGQVVVIMDDNLPPLQWSLGRSAKLHYGRDNVARVAEVKTASGVVSRPVRKLCPLPNQFQPRGALTLSNFEYSLRINNNVCCIKHNEYLIPIVKVVDNSASLKVVSLKAITSNCDMTMR
ncbi:uncharacterized protein [Rhodnius prolixus]|uniref:uncharacterized protein n=1 Tax=Rhodnius prolixus TaxID=13249 RepID=UPI003D18D5EA